MSRKRRTTADEPFLVMRSSTSNLRGGVVLKDHAHEWHQLIYVSEGVIVVWTEVGSWVAPPSRAIWVPAGRRHGVRFVGECSFRTLYFRPDVWLSLPDQCTVVTVSALLRELILRTTVMVMLDRREALDSAIALVILNEFRRSSAPSFALPQPTTELTRRAAALIVDGAPQASTIDGLARVIGVGTRTLERLFVAETGVTLGRWRQHHALLAALERIALGEPIKAVAVTAGYSNPSAFVAAFRSLFGTTPGRYFAGE